MIAVSNITWVGASYIRCLRARCSYFPWFHERRISGEKNGMQWGFFGGGFVLLLLLLCWIYVSEKTNITQ